MAYESLEDIAFDESDKNLFQIDDLRLKADAIKYSILPKLHVLTHHAILCHICNIGKSNKDDTDLRKLNKK